MANTVLLVGTLSEARDIPHEGVRVMSCGQHPAAFSGLRVSAVYATESAKRHRNFEKVLELLRYCARKTQPAGLERIV